MVAISRNSCRICYSATTPNTEHLMATRSFAIPSLHIDSASWADLLQHEKTPDEMQQMVTGYLAYGRSMDWTLDAEYDGDVDLPRPLSWTLEQWRTRAFNIVTLWCLKSTKRTIMDLELDGIRVCTAVTEAMPMWTSAVPSSSSVTSSSK